MRIGTALLVALLSSAVAQDKPTQIAWERDLNATLARARKENRPILVAINALDNESGNRATLSSVYTYRSLVATTRPMLCLVANPNDHDRAGTCSRFGKTDCKTHRAVLTYALRRWSRTGDLISPQHMILSPEAKLLWRQEYMVSAPVLQRQCEKALVETAPDRALRLAMQTRAEAIRALERGGDPKGVLKAGDPLAAAVYLSMWEEDEDERWLDALKDSPPQAFPLVRLYLVDEPAFLPVARAIDRKRAAWWSKRLHATAAKAPPPHDPKLKRAFLALKKGDSKGLDRLLAAFDHPVNGPEVRAALAELAGVDHGPQPDGWKEQFAK